MAGRERAENLRLARIGNVEDRRSLRPVLMADVGIFPVDDDLSSARKLHPAEMANVRRCARRSAAIAFSAGKTSLMLHLPWNLPATVTAAMIAAR